ncbi:YncE family protein [Bacteroidales bacterium AH-315-N07]|nr:YncE family protein [Bacteroidales bacterium AH-315-N07]
MNMISRYLLLFITLLLGITSCKKNEEIGPQQSNKDSNAAADSINKYCCGVFIINEGSFQWGNASISFYNPATSTVENNIFQNVNNRPLGDVAQSMTIYNGKGYIVVDNSQKIEVVDANTFKYIGVIENLVAPRYLLVVNPYKAYITDIYADHIAVIDLKTFSKTKQIPVTGWTEQMVHVNERVFVTNMDSSRVYVINANTDSVITSISVTKSPNSLRLDINNDIWVLCSGGYNVESPALIQIDPDSYSIIQKITFPDISDSPGKLRINGNLDTLYYLNNHVYRMSINDVGLPAKAFVSGTDHLFYGIGVDSKSGSVYVADAIDYVQQGIVYSYHAKDGATIDSFKVGIIPGEFAFN